MSKILETLVRDLLSDLASVTEIDSEAGAIVTKFNNTAGTSFDKDMKYKPEQIDTNGIKLRKNGSYDIKFKTNDGSSTRTVNSNDLEDARRPSGNPMTDSKPTPPDLKKQFELVGLQNLDSPDFNEVFKAYNTSYQSTPMTTVWSNVYNAFKGDANAADLGIKKPPEPAKSAPPGEDTPQAKVTKDGLDKTKKGWSFYKDIVKPGAELGKWVTTLIPTGVTIFGAYEVWKHIHDHQMAMNGCWYVNTKTGKKTKIGALTCNNDLNKICGGISSNDSTTYPCLATTYCSDVKKCYPTDADPSINKTYGAFNPCPITTIPAPGRSPSDAWPGPYQTSSPYCGNSGCITCVGNTNCKPGGASCSDSCQTGDFNVQPDYVLMCVDVDFWGAATDFFGDDLFGGGGDMFGGIIKVLFWVAVVIGGLWLLSFIIRFFRLIKNRMTG